MSLIYLWIFTLKNWHKNVENFGAMSPFGIWRRKLNRPLLIKWGTNNETSYRASYGVINWSCFRAYFGFLCHCSNQWFTEFAVRWLIQRFILFTLFHILIPFLPFWITSKYLSIFGITSELSHWILLVPGVPWLVMHLNWGSSWGSSCLSH